MVVTICLARVRTETRHLLWRSRCFPWPLAASAYREGLGIVTFHELWRFAVPISACAPSVGCAASPHKQPNHILTGFGKLLVALGMILFALSGHAALRIPNFPVIFIHGVNDNAEDNWGGFQRFLSANGWIFGGIVRYNLNEDHVRVRGILADSILDANQSPADFYSVQFSSNNELTFQQQGQELSKIIAAVLNVTKRNKVILVGHSMGGLAARAYLQSVPYLTAQNVAKLVTIGTPHQGSRESDHCLSKGIGIFLSMLCWHKDAKEIGPRSLSPDSESILDLNAPDLKLNAPGLMHIYQKLPTSVEYNSIIVSWGTHRTLTKCCLQLPPNASPEYGEPGDGIVTAASQDISNITKNNKYIIHNEWRVDLSDAVPVAFTLPSVDTKINTFGVNLGGGIGCGHFEKAGYVNEIHTCETSLPEVWYYIFK